jgi:hypothetical protein
MQVDVSCNSAARIHDECVCDNRGAVFKGCGERNEEAVRGNFLRIEKYGSLQDGRYPEALADKTWDNTGCKSLINQFT